MFFAPVKSRQGTKIWNMSVSKTTDYFGLIGDKIQNEIIFFMGEGGFYSLLNLVCFNISLCYQVC